MASGLYLERSDGSRLEPEVSLEILGYLPDKALEGQLTDQQLGGLLVPPDLTEGHGTGPVPMGLLNASGGRGRFPRSLSGQLLPGGLASGGLAGGLLGTSHGVGDGGEERVLDEAKGSSQLKYEYDDDDYQIPSFSTLSL
jgi:hypothetical protein